MSLARHRYVGDVVIEASGGTYTDEATGASTTLSEPMQVVLASQGGQATGVITPLTAAAFTVTVMGVSSTINVANVPMPTTQAEFCDGLAADTTFSQINAGGSGTMTINSCSFSGNTGNIAATLTITSPVTLSTSYTIVYTYQ